MKQSSLLFLVILAFCNLSGFAQSSTLVINKNNSSGYNIYIAPNAPSSVKNAAEDLKMYLFKTVGASLKITSTDKKPTGNYISLGTNTAYKSSGLTMKGIVGDGFKIVTVGKNIFIYGEDTADGKENKLGGFSNGTANGVYAFLERFLGISWLMPTEQGEFVPEIKSLEIAKTNLTENPPLIYRNEPYIGPYPAAKQWTKRMKLGTYVIPQYNHSWEKTIDPKLYDTHPEYFAKVDGKHLPPAERFKLETTNPDLVQAFADVAIKAFRADSNLKWYSLSPSDGISGQADWSNSPEALALLEKMPDGEISRTKLILKFYNDVAKIVGKEFPNRKLGGYIYSNYFYPPSNGIPKIEPNLAFMIAPSIDYGYQLYKKSTQDDWEKSIGAWAKASKENGFDLYYYDLPVSIMQHKGIVMPPSPEILNFIFSRLLKYGFKGAYIYGRPVWPVFGSSNYAIAKMKWNPGLDANVIMDEYYEKAYGAKAGKTVGLMYQQLDSAYKAYYNKDERANYNLTERHLKEVYGPLYPKMEAKMLKALSQISDDKSQAYRLQQLADVFAIMNWNLRSLGYLPGNYKSALTKSDEEVDAMITRDNDKDLGVVTDELPIILTEPVIVKEAVFNGKTTGNKVLPTSRGAQFLFYATDKEVKVKFNHFEPIGEFVRYRLLKSNGDFIKGGGVIKGKKIIINAEKGQSYVLDLNNRRAEIDISVDGALVASKANGNKNGSFVIPLELVKTDSFLVYFYAPEGSKSVGFNMSVARNVIARVYNPDGELAGSINTIEGQSARFVAEDATNKEGFWKIEILKAKADKDKSLTLILDRNLPQWFMTDGAGLIKFGN